MQLTTLRRFEFSAARQLPNGRLYGNNFFGWLGVTGALNPSTGMLINIVELKHALNDALDFYDHRTLNHSLPGIEPTTLNIAQSLWKDLRPLLPAHITLSELHLEEMHEHAAHLTAERAAWVWQSGFSAAHRTHAPQLSAAENQRLFGICNHPNGHGHNYRVQVYLPAPAQVPHGLLTDLDHRNLSRDVPELTGRSIVTETLCHLLAQRVPQAVSVRVWETDTFYAEYFPTQDRYELGRRYHFHAAHRLNSPALTAEENHAIFGKCNRPDPHGHTYTVLLTVGGKLDPRTETAYDLAALDAAVQPILDELDYRYLDVEIPFFSQNPSTGENIAAYLFERLQTALAGALRSVQVWETANNCFVARA
ncbi:MAG: hypothetical protein OHK0052_27900 [Anaerolineales bacterium]